MSDLLPLHPEEDRLRLAETDLADLLRHVAAGAAEAVEQHDRVTAAVELARLVLVADAARIAMVKATNDQMAVDA